MRNEPIPPELMARIDAFVETVERVITTDIESGTYSPLEHAIVAAAGFAIVEDLHVEDEEEPKS